MPIRTEDVDAETVRVVKALVHAGRVHEGQIYRSYRPGFEDEKYLLHVIRVMDLVAMQKGTPKLIHNATVVAVLHDVLEDGGELPDWLEPDEVEALTYITRNKETESYDEYISRMLASDSRGAFIARIVKRVDLKENLSRLPEEHSLRQRYEKALSRLRYVDRSTRRS